MTMQPWGQQPATPPWVSGEPGYTTHPVPPPPPPPPPPQPPTDDLTALRKQYPGLADRALQMILEGKIEPSEQKPGWTWPWQEEHWDPRYVPEWARTVGKVGLGVGLAAGGAALGGWGIPAALGWASGAAPALTGPALAAMAHPTALGVAGGLGGLMGSSMITPDQPLAPGQPPVEPPVIPGEPPPLLPEPGEDVSGVGPEGEPQVITVGGQQFWWNPTGGIYGTGGWDILPEARVPGLTPEQQIEQARLDREAAERRTGISAGLTGEQEIAQMEAQRQWEAQQSEAQRAAQLQMLQMQGGFEQQRLGEQAGYARQHQMAGAAQQMSQMYAADPYKYWAQMGGGTPEAVARLTGGQVAPGAPMGQVPLSMPSQQWWGNLLPSEQQQIMGGVNWLGVDPQDWMATQQRMIPGMGSRQMGPQWAR